jgi:SAM-dependent methyltransferase
VVANSVRANLEIWDRRHAWPLDGDEWTGQARACGVPYERWKASVVPWLVAPHLPPRATVLEIGPGRGRWSALLAPEVGRLVLVDLSPSCLEACRARLAGHRNVECWRTDGAGLPPGLDGTVDLVWSFDVFVHLDAATIAAYLREAARVLRPGGTAVLHHAGRRHATLPLGGLRHLGTPGRIAYRWLSMGAAETVDGWRSNVSARLFAGLAAAAGLEVVRQESRWGPAGEFGVPRHGDRISTLRRPG